MTEPN